MLVLYIYIQDTVLVITVPADSLAPLGAKRPQVQCWHQNQGIKLFWLSTIP